MDLKVLLVKVFRLKKIHVIFGFLLAILSQSFDFTNLLMYLKELLRQRETKKNKNFLC